MEMPFNQIRAMGVPGRLERAAEIQRQIDVLSQALESLQSEGHTILAGGIGASKPYVILANSRLLSHLAEQGKAAFYMRGTDHDGQHYRKGQLLDYRAVIVTWLERGH